MYQCYTMVFAVEGDLCMTNDDCLSLGATAMCDTYFCPPTCTMYNGTQHGDPCKGITI